jgi:hypothetical protein
LRGGFPFLRIHRIARRLGADPVGDRLQLALRRGDGTGLLATLGGEAGDLAVEFLEAGFDCAEVAAVAVEHVAGLEFGLAEPLAQLLLRDRVQADARQLAQQLALVLAELRDELGRTRQPLGDLVLLAADVA